MTCNNIILAKPEAGASVPYSLPAGESARLSFGPGEISGLNLNADGGLVIRFVQGGELTLTNFQEMVDGGNLLYLADGTLVDPAVLQASLASYVSPAAGSDAIVVGIPAANQVKEYTVEAGQEYVLDFDIDVPVTAGRQNGDFVMTFENGGMVVLRGYETAMASADAPTITSTSKVCVYEGEELITNIQTLAEAPVVEEKVAVEEEIAAPKKIVKVEEATQAEEVALVEPAAGEPSAEQIAQIEPAAGEPGASNSGYGFNSQPGTDPLGSLADVGPIDPTALNYGVEFRQEDPARALKNLRISVTNPSYEIDETDQLGDIQTGGKVNVNFGGDGSGRIVPVTNGFTSDGSRKDDALTTGGSKIDVRVVGDSYIGFDEQNNEVFEFYINPTTGEFTYVQYMPFDHGNPLDDNDVIALYFDVQVIDRDGDRGKVTIRVDVKDDAPSINSAGGAVDETDLKNGPVVTEGKVSHDFGQDVPGDGFIPTGEVPSVSNGMVDGSLMNNALTSGGVPVVITYDDATRTYTGTAGGMPVFTMKFYADGEVAGKTGGEYTFTLFAPIDHADPDDPNDIINIDFPVSAVDYDGDTATGSVRIQILDDAPVIGDSYGHVDETNFVNGDLVHTDIVSNSLGQDMASVEGFEGGDNSSVALVSNGIPVLVNYDTATHTYVGKAGNVTVFTLAIDPATGKYTYTQYENLDHPVSGDDSNGEHNDLIRLEFDVVLRGPAAADQRVVNGKIVIDVADDGPVARNDYSAAEAGQLITGNLFGNDDLSTDAPNTITQIVTKDGVVHDQVVGGVITVNGEYGTLRVTVEGPNAGRYTYTAKDRAGVPDNAANVDEFTYTLKDNDDDTSTAKLQITVTDEGTPTDYPDPVPPVIGNDELAVDETSLKDGGVLLDGKLKVDQGTEEIISVDGIRKADGSAEWSYSGSYKGTKLQSGGEDVEVQYDANTRTYTGTAGGRTVFTLQLIGNDGDYRFTLLDTLDHQDGTDPNDIIRLDFGVRVTDKDNDTADGTITVRVYDDAPVAYDDGTRAVVDGETVQGNVMLGQHGANGVRDELGQDGETLLVAVNGIPVPADGTSVTIPGSYGTLSINNKGEYSYTAINNNVAGLVDQFTYTIQDYDGDRDTATFSFTTQPDAAPVFVGGSNQVDETDMPIANGVVGAHAPKHGNVTVTSSTGDLADLGTVTVTGLTMPQNTGLTHDGQPVLVSFNANTGTYTGTAGGEDVFTMVIRADGSYTFTLIKPVDHPVKGSSASAHNDTVAIDFPVRATDGNGDKVDGVVKITIFDDGPDIGEANGAVDEGDSTPLRATGTVPHSFGADGTGEIRGTGTWGASGSVAGGQDNLHSGGQKVDVQWDAGQNAYIGTINGGATEVLRLHIDPATGAYTYTQSRPLDHGDPDDPRDVMTLRFDIEIVDGDGDTDPGRITIDVMDDGPTILVDAVNLAHERDLATGDVMRQGDVTVTFSGDGTGKIVGRDFSDYNGNMLPNGLTHNGQPVTVKFFENEKAFIGYLGNDKDDAVFRLEIDEDGQYRFYLYEQLDHADENINLIFGITAIPTTGTAGAVDGLITIRVTDDTPLARDNHGGTTSGTQPNLNGNVVVDDKAGADGPVYVTQVRIGSQVVDLPANSNENVTVTTANGTLSINRLGVWTYVAKDKQNGTDVFSYTIKDFDGDTSSATLTVVARDLVPTAVNDTNATTGTQPTTGGNILSNDTGGDGTTYVTEVVFNGTPYAIPSSGSSTITTPNGTLTIDRTGQYTYVAKDKQNGTDVFTYKISDADGDTSSATLTVTVQDRIPVAVNDTNNIGTGQSGSGNVLTNDTKGDGELVVTNPGTYNLDFGRLVINADGSYTYTRFNVNRAGTDRFTYNIRDEDGDTSSATLTLTQTARPQPPVIPTPPPVWGGGDGGGGDGCPLIIDLTGTGVTLTGKADGVAFDMDLDGVADWTAWAGVGSGFLVLDKNGDGQINDRSEMFGDTDGFSDGFDNLASYDKNGDGVIDANDEIYGDLRVWHDMNQDGVSDEHELLTLEQIGIVGIRLTADLPEGLYIEGNWISHVSTIIMADGSERDIVDAWLKYDKGYQAVDVGEQDAVYGNEGADAFLFTAIGEAATTVYNFNASEGDRLDLSAILQEQDDVTDAINEFVYARQDGDDLVISVDVTRSGDIANAVDIARLDGIDDLDLDSLLQNGNITG